MKTLTFIVLCVFSTLAFAGETQEAQFKVSGNCAMCKSRIEKAVTVKGVRYAKWNKSSKILTVAFLVPGMTADSLQHLVAAVGHDTEKYRAPDAVYAGLPPCCHYRENPASH